MDSSATLVSPIQVLEKVEVWESIHREGKGRRHRLYRVKLSFLPESYYVVSIWAKEAPLVHLNH